METTLSMPVVFAMLASERVFVKTWSLSYTRSLAFELLTTPTPTLVSVSVRLSFSPVLHFIGVSALTHLSIKYVVVGQYKSEQK